MSDQETMVERVVEAMQKSDDDYGTSRNGAYWEDMARAAIEAMRGWCLSILR